jgi:hypothetical protein
MLRGLVGSWNTYLWMADGLCMTSKNSTRINIMRKRGKMEKTSQRAQVLLLVALSGSGTPSNKRCLPRLNRGSKVIRLSSFTASYLHGDSVSKRMDACGRGEPATMAFRGKEPRRAPLSLSPDRRSSPQNAEKRDSKKAIVQSDGHCAS